jgi:hypothetical protein
MSGATLVTITLLSCATIFAQSKPDFTGTWKSDTARSDSAHQATPIGPITLKISQTAGEIRIETKTRPKDRPLVANEALIYKLDGSENRVAGNSGVPVTCRAHWEGSALVLETSRSVNGSTVTTNWTLTLPPPGNELTVKKTLAVQHGYESLDAKNVGTGTDIFIRTGARTKD